MDKTLQQRIEEYPTVLYNALKKLAECEREVAQLEEEEKMSPQHTFSFEGERRLVKLESAINLLKIKLDQAKSEVEVAHRAENPKATESSSKAAVLSDEKVADLRAELVALEERKSLMEIDINEAGEKARLVSSTLDNDDTNLEVARRKQEAAEFEIERVKSTFECYKLLAELYVGK